MFIGIDLGTTNSAISYIDEFGQPQIIPNREGERTTPSVIYFEQDKPIVGQAAKTMSVMDPLNTVQFVKRQIGNSSFKFITPSGTTYTAEELSALILKRLKEDAEQYLGQEIQQVVVTVPAYFDDAQRKATMDAGAIAGLEVLQVINEPTAAALAYGIRNRNKNQNIVVYDLGGGTFDVTVLSFTELDVHVKATGGDRNLGGFDFDNHLMSYVQEKFLEEHGVDLYDDEVAMQELRERTEACKKTLTVRQKSMISVASQGKAARYEVTKQQFEDMNKFLLNRTVGIMESVLKESGFQWADIDKILLVGGSTRMPAVLELIEKTTGITPSSTDVNPDEAVSLGAAIQTALLLDDASSTIGKVIDVNSHSLGVIARNSFTGELYNSIILPKNTALPASKSETFHTTVDNQDYIELRITEGEGTNPSDVRIIGETRLELKQNMPAETPIVISISYDRNGLVHAKARDEKSQAMLGELKINRTSNLSKETVEEKKSKFLTIHVD